MTLTAPKALIMVVSRPDSLEVAAEKLSPEVIGIIASQNILKDVVLKCAELENRDGSNVGFEFQLVDSAMEIGDAFGRFVRLLDGFTAKGYEHADILLDATGGTTPMRLGAALAAMSRGIEMVHQRWPQYYDKEQDRWIYEEGSKVEVVPMRNPLEATGLLRDGQAVELFNRRDYGAAALVFEDVAGKVTGAERRHYYGGLLLLAKGYGAWDVADYKEAIVRLQQARRELGVEFGEADLAERAGTLADHVGRNLSFLGDVQGKLSVENVVDMVENARRRILDQGRYDDGVARLYRTVEMWHQWRLLKRQSVSTKGTRWEQVPAEAKAKLRENTGLTELPKNLDLMRARTLDRILNNEESVEDDNLFRDLLQKRNDSILAHGLKPIGEAPARKFLDYVDAMVNRPQVRTMAEHPRLRQL